MIIALLFACGEKQDVEIPEVVVKESQETKVEAVVENTKKKPASSLKKKQGTLLLDGVEQTVFWDDGDTFSFSGSEGKKVKARLKGLNTLESYGPVHQWGDWTESELYSFAKEGGVFASAQKWNCTDTKQGGGYGRILVDCPDFRKAILEAGLAHAFSVDQASPDADVVAQQIGMDAQIGIWEKGVPKSLLTSIHSQDEKADKDAYNRVCQTETGQCDVVTHTEIYEVCQKVCQDDSCMIYVPYKQRYGADAASCLKLP
jgi:micrococcal nuclease